MSKKSDFLTLELALTELSIQLMLTKCSEHNPQMFFVFFLTLGVDQNVINEYHDKLVR